ncbi:MAG: hypothetical protein ACAF41_20695 [Leptolyngbya sp. BL-A-14]
MTTLASGRFHNTPNDCPHVVEVSESSQQLRHSSMTNPWKA